MIEPASLEPAVRVCGQITVSDIAFLTSLGVTLIVNNRPEGESHDQPPGAEIEAATQTAGIAYVAIPVSGMPNAQAVARVGQVLASLPPDGRVLMYCKSGMRSAAAWAMARRNAGADVQRLRDQAGAAGYDLSRLPL